MASFLSHREISHTVADITVHGSLSSVHCSLDLYKYKLIRGLLENNLGEPIEEFMRPYDLQDPRIHVSRQTGCFRHLCGYSSKKAGSSRAAGGVGGTAGGLDSLPLGSPSGLCCPPRPD